MPRLQCSGKGDGESTAHCQVAALLPPALIAPFPSCVPAAWVRTGEKPSCKKHPVLYLKGKRNIYQGSLRKVLIREGREEINEKTLLQGLGFFVLFSFLVLTIIRALDLPN